MDGFGTRATLGRVLLFCGLVGVAVTVVATVLGLRVLGDLAETTTTGAGKAEDAIVVVQRTLAETEATTRELATVFSDAKVLLDATADLSEDDIAESLDAVEEAMPALIEVAAVIDRTLATLDAVPFGPSYNPQEPFDASLRRVQGELEGVPDSLRQQATLIRDTGASLTQVRSGTIAVADNLAELQTTLAQAGDVLASSPDEASAQERLGQRLRTGRILAIALGLTAAGAYAAAAAAGWVMLVGSTRDP